MWWAGDPPRAGDGLETRTGRRYLILKVVMGTPALRGALRPPLGGNATVKRLDCVVLPPGEPIEGEIFGWQWAPRRSRRSLAR